LFPVFLVVFHILCVFSGPLAGEDNDPFSFVTTLRKRAEFRGARLTKEYSYEYDLEIVDLSRLTLAVKMPETKLPYTTNPNAGLIQKMVTAGLEVLPAGQTPQPLKASVVVEVQESLLSSLKRSVASLIEYVEEHGRVEKALPQERKILESNQAATEVVKLGKGIIQEVREGSQSAEIIEGMPFGTLSKALPERGSTMGSTDISRGEAFMNPAGTTADGYKPSVHREAVGSQGLAAAGSVEAAADKSAFVEPELSTPSEQGPKTDKAFGFFNRPTAEGGENVRPSIPFPDFVKAPDAENGQSQVGQPQLDDATLKGETGLSSSSSNSTGADQELPRSSHGRPLSSGGRPVVSRVLRFIREINDILEKAADSGEAIGIDDSMSDRPPESKDSADLPGKAGMARTTPEGCLRGLLADKGVLYLSKTIGISLTDTGRLQLNSTSLASDLSAHGGETMAAIHDFGVRVSDRIDILANPFVGLYACDKMVIRAATVHDGDEASSLEEQLTAKQNSLNSRLKELELLIEQSTVLRDWFAHKKQNPLFDFEVAQ
jgi:hypothetical protein